MNLNLPTLAEHHWWLAVPFLAFVPAPFVYTILLFRSLGFARGLFVLCGQLALPILLITAYFKWERLEQLGLKQDHLLILVVASGIGSLFLLRAANWVSKTYSHSRGATDHQRILNGVLVVFTAVFKTTFGFVFFLFIGVRYVEFIAENFLTSLCLWFAVINLLSFQTMRADKEKALSGITRNRTSEWHLHYLEALGGFLGSFAAQRRFRHKISKFPYQYNFWTIVVFYLLAFFCFDQWNAIDAPIRQRIANKLAVEKATESALLGPSTTGHDEPTVSQNIERREAQNDWRELIKTEDGLNDFVRSSREIGRIKGDGADIHVLNRALRVLAANEVSNDYVEEFVGDCLSLRVGYQQSGNNQFALLHTTACVATSKLNLHSERTIRKLANLTRREPQTYRETDVRIHAARCLANLPMTKSEVSIAAEAFGKASDFFYNRSKNARLGAETSPHNDLIRAFILREFRAKMTALPKDVESYKRLSIEVRTHPLLKELMSLDDTYLRFYRDSRDEWQQLLKTNGVESI